jgi:glycine/D-amino acid oxidase-like deaminating enzyme
VVIGAGITGTLVAHELARAGWHVQVLEAEHVGAGSSSRTAAGIRQQFSTPETVLGMRYAVDVYRNFPERVGGAEVPIVQNGYLFLLDTAEDVERARARLRMQHRCGLTEAELLEGNALTERFPWVEPRAVLAATWCPSDGFLHPATVYNEAAAAGQRLGVELIQRAPVVGAEHRDGRIDTVVSTRGRHPADLVVDATNAWSPRLARVLGGVELPIVPLKRYLWFLERGASLSADTLLAMPLTIAPSGAYVRPENGNSALMGWSRDTPPEPDFSYEDQDRIAPEFFHRTGTDSIAYETWAALAEVIPAFGEFAGVTATTAGYYATTPDHNPFLGYDPQVPNLVRLAGFSGHGAMFGPFTALVAGELARAGRDVETVSALGRDVPIAAFRLDREPAHAETQVI